MKPPFAAQAREAGTRAGTAGRQFSAVAFALDRLFPKRGRAPYSAAERLVVLVIVRATSADGSSGDFNCFLSYPTIAKWAGVSIASVKRALQKHCDGPAPLLYRSMTGETRGHAHGCYRFTLVMHPERFAAARDAARTAKHQQVDRAMRDLQPDRIALQRQLKDFGGTLTDLEYREKLAGLERATRRKLPARAVLKRPDRDGRAEAGSPASAGTHQGRRRE
jgi:DNA-binding transcriptional MerR regulator